MVSESHNAVSRVDGNLVQAERIGVVNFYGRSAGASHEPCYLVPEQRRPFVDRAAESSRIETALETGSKSRMAVVTGMPGVGRRALARQWAADHRDWFPGGQLHVDLAPNRRRGRVQAGDVLAGLLSALGWPPAELTDRSYAGLLAAYRAATAGQEILLVVEGAESFGEVVPILPNGAGNAVLITAGGGRHDFATVAATVCDLRPLGPEHSLELLASVSGRPESDLSGAMVDGVLRGCGGLPLALTIVGAWLGSTELADREIASIVDHELSLNGNLSKVFSTAYRSLNKREQRVYRILGQLPTEYCNVEMLAVMAERSVPEVSGVVARLCDRRLLSGNGKGQYEVHTLVRRHARGLLEPARRERAWRLLIDYHRAFVDRSDRLLTPDRLRLSAQVEDRGMPGLPAAAACVGSEMQVWHGSTTAALAQAAQAGEWDAVWRMAEGLWTPYRQIGLFEELCEVYEYGVQAAEHLNTGEISRADILAEMSGRLAFSLAECGRVDDAADAMGKAQEAISASNNEHLKASLMEWTGIVLRAQGNLCAAIKCHLLAREMFVGIGRDRGVYLQDLLIGQLLTELDQLDDACRVLERGLSAASGSGDSRTERKFRWQLADVAVRSGSLDKAENALSEVAADAASAHDYLMLFKCRDAQAKICRQQGRHLDEATFLREVIKVGVFPRPADRDRVTERLMSLTK